MAVTADEVGQRRRRLPVWRRAVEAARDTSLGYGEWLWTEVASTTRGRSVAAGRHALVVATSLPPRFDGGVFRPLSWLRYAAENGWHISAVTRAATGSETEGGRQLAATIPPHVVVAEAPPSPLKPSQRLFQQVDGEFLTALALYRAGVERFETAPPSVIVATGPSFAAFIAGLFLKRRFGARLVLDYRDEWTENPFGFVLRRRDDRRWERRCLAAADRVFFTTEGQLAHADACFPGLIGAKGGVLLNGWEPDPSVTAAERLSRDDGRLLIAHSGVVGSMVPPDAFLMDLATIVQHNPALKGRVRLQFVGRRLPAAERMLNAFPFPDMLELIDERPRAEADRLIRLSDVLLLLSNRDLARYLPGKLFEYLASGKPILVHGHGGEAQALVERLHAGLHAEAGETATLAHALDALSGQPEDAWNGQARQDWALTHTRREMARLFFERLSALVEARAAEASSR